MAAAHWRASFNFGSQQRDLLAHAGALLQIGAGDRARCILDELRPQQLSDVRDAMIATEMCLDVHLLDQAWASIERAGELDPDHAEVAQLRAECRYWLDQPAILQAEGQAIRGTLDRVNALASGHGEAADQHVHIVGNLDSIGGSERRALNLRRLLAARMPTTLWTTVPAHAEHARECAIRLISSDDAPTGGTLVLIGTYYECGDWLERGRFERIVVCHNLVEQNQNLLRCLQRIERNAAHPRVQLTFPSKLFRDLLGLPGAIEYSPVDLTHFQRRRTQDNPRFTVGRHGRAYIWKYHANDSAFFRAMLARGYGVRILGGSVIAHLFARDSGAKPELIEAGTLDARDFLDGLDVFVYRKHPQFFETGGSVILEAMAMELPVVAFPEQCGCAELIVHEENGFLVHSEAEAFAIIERLRADRNLRQRIGAAARQTLLDLWRWQEPALLDFYRGEGERAAER